MDVVLAVVVFNGSCVYLLRTRVRKSHPWLAFFVSSWTVFYDLSLLRDLIRLNITGIC